MKNFIFLSSAILFAYCLKAQNVNIPDPIFKAALVANSSINTNMDNEIQVSEANVFTGTIDVIDMNISDITGIEAFINLTYLECGYNQISNIDLSSNTELKILNCSGNLLTSLDISNNTVLDTLWCADNQLTSLDLSNNAILKTLICSKNNIDTLNLVYCPQLFHLRCYKNQLTSLDLSSNPDLKILHCDTNQLKSLNIQNGNNTNLTWFEAKHNPELHCIQVDDPSYASTHFVNIDPFTVFSEKCLCISGKIVLDNNCIMSGTERELSGVIVRAMPNNYCTITDSLGEYTLVTDTGIYQVEVVDNNPTRILLCPLSNYHTVIFDSFSSDTTGIDFYFDSIACPYLTIDINSDRRRRCSTNNTFVHYCNDGFADVDSVEVTVQLPDYVEFVSANYPYTIDTLGNYIFDIGLLAQGDCGDIHIVDSVACINGIIGLTQCTKAWITPKNNCVYQLDSTYSQWDHSSVMVEGKCIGDTIVRFTITNTGTLGSGDMQQQSEYRIYEDALLVYTGTFQLLGEENLAIDIPSNGMTYRLEADQNPFHPGNSNPNTEIEACGAPYNSIGFVNQMPQDDEDSETEIDCMQIVDSYDPNDKSVSPVGITSNNFILPGTELDYVIRFQNTGSAEAVDIVVVDTLSEYLDLSTFQAGISSHPYELDLRGQGQPVLIFQFFNINLPDSTTDEANSHGFVKFKIAPYDSLPNGTIIENTADIYFDYNVPVITNTTFLTISDTVLYGNPLVIQDTRKPMTDIRIFPNPTTGKITIQAEDMRGIEVYNLHGQLICKKPELGGQTIEMDLCKQPKGIYFIKVTTNKAVAVDKIVLE